MISKGNHVKFAPFALLADWYFFYTFRNKLLVPLTVVTIFFFAQCIIKQLDSVFVISRVVKVSVRVISQSRIIV